MNYNIYNFITYSTRKGIVFHTILQFRFIVLTFILNTRIELFSNAFKLEKDVCVSVKMEPRQFYHNVFMTPREREAESLATRLYFFSRAILKTHSFEPDRKRERERSPLRDQELSQDEHSESIFTRFFPYFPSSRLIVV